MKMTWPWVLGAVSGVLFSLAVLVVALVVQATDGSPGSNTIGHGPGGDVPEAVAAELSTIPTYADAVPESPPVWDGLDAETSYWLKETEVDAVVTFYQRELVASGWTTKGAPSDVIVPLDFPSEASDAQAAAPEPTGAVATPREVRAVTLLFERSGWNSTITVVENPYKDPARGTVQVSILLQTKQ